MVKPITPKDIERSFVYLLEANGTTVTDKGKVKGTFHKCSLDILIKSLRRYRKPCDLKIYLNDPFVANAINKDLRRWQQSDFTKSNGKEVSNKEEWKELSALVNQHSVLVSTEKNEYSKWMEGEICNM